MSRITLDYAGHAQQQQNAIALTSTHEKSALQQACLSRRRWRWGLLSILIASTLVCLAVRDAIGIESHSERLLRGSAPQESVEVAYSASQERRQLNIFGKDGRQRVTDPSLYPYSAVGLLRWNDNVTCTASLVAESFAVTAAECVLDSDGNLRPMDQRSPEFLATQPNGKTRKASVAQVHKQSDFWTKWTRNTYVLLELDTALGAICGVLKLPTAQDLAQQNAEPMNVQLTGFSTEEDAGMSFQVCTLHFPSEFHGPVYLLHHDCDVSSKRSPGSPLLVRSTSFDTYVVGIHSNAIGDNQRAVQGSMTYAVYGDAVANRGVLGSFIQRQLSFLLQEAASSSSVSLSAASSASSDGSVGQENGTSAGGSSIGATSNSLGSSGEDKQTGPSAGASSASLSSSSSGAESGPQYTLASAAGYTCIGAVSASWVAIIFIAARRIHAARGNTIR